jgi:hypothetical protein
MFLRPRRSTWTPGLEIATSSTRATRGSTPGRPEEPSRLIMTAGLWRTGWDGVPERLSSFAVRRVVVGCHGMEVSLILPRTGESSLYAGTLDEISSAVHRAGVRLGVRGDRQGIFWALREFVGLAQRQAAARGGC